jgi:hypothetical protein
MKAAIFKLGERVLHLAYNGAAMFSIEESHGGIKDLAGTLDGRVSKGYDATCEVAALLAEQGELVRRYYGHDPLPVVKADEIKLMLQPSRVAELAGAIFSAIELGYGRELDEGSDDEVDIGLMELAQKKTR